MPELPDIVIYIESLERRILGQPLQRARLASPFVLRTVTPPVQMLEGRVVERIERIGKRIAIGLEQDLYLVIHLMIAGRLQWSTAAKPLTGKKGLGAFDFPSGTLTLTEAGSKRRCSLHIVQGPGNLRDFRRGGIEVLGSSLDAFREALCRENHTLKRSLTDPRLFSGIGNAYSDEVLHRARLSPMKLTAKMTEDEIGRLHDATRNVLTEWIDRLRIQTGSEFPSKVTAFRPEMSVHGRFGKPRPNCGTPVQRIVYAENECNYCTACQTGGRLLADRAISRLLREDWPRSLDEWEERKEKLRGPPR